MKFETAYDIIKNELKCVKRAEANECDRRCEVCDLLRDASEIITAYQIALKSIETIERVQSILNANLGDKYAFEEIYQAIDEFEYDTGVQNEI